MRILFIGDVVGRSGREAVGAALPQLREALRIDLAVVNAENASHGFGLAPDMAAALFAAGADVITLGNHAWDRKEIIPYIAETPRLIRALNFPPGTPGGGLVVVEVPGGRRALVLQAMGRLFMDPLDCPFRATADLLARYRLGGDRARRSSPTSTPRHRARRWRIAHFLDGQVSMVIGTHTHCPSADAQVLPGGTAFQSDAGMSGDYDSVIGMAKDAATLRFWRKMPGERLAPAEGEATVCGVFVETDDATRAGATDRAGAGRGSSGADCYLRCRRSRLLQSTRPGARPPQSLRCRRGQMPARLLIQCDTLPAGAAGTANLLINEFGLDQHPRATAAAQSPATGVLVQVANHLGQQRSLRHGERQILHRFGLISPPVWSSA